MQTKIEYSIIERITEAEYVINIKYIEDLSLSINLVIKLSNKGRLLSVRFVSLKKISKHS